MKLQIADASAIPFRDPGTNHREGKIDFKYLLRGEEGSRQNYELSIVRTTDRFFGPPHRHNFDQIRYVLSGTFGQPGVLELRSGQVGYYPEATPYQIDSGNAEILSLQFGGASGNGFTHYHRLRETYPVLAQLGKFTDGIFRWNDPPAGTAKQQDGYEAMWEHINKRPLVYPRARYRQPVVMIPEGFEWMPGGQAGLSTKLLGEFTERRIAVEQTRIAAGMRVTLDSAGSIRLVYVLQGEGVLEGQPLRPGVAVELRSGRAYAIEAREDLVLFDMYLPGFDDAVPAERADKVREAVA